MTLSIIIFTVLSMGGSIYTVMVYFDTPECSVRSCRPAATSSIAQCTWQPLIFFSARLPQGS
jgi:hypothetical protein